MANQKKQYYGIKFPFTSNNLDGFFLDLNEEIKDKVASEIIHTVLTPKRSRIKNPDFGTDLIKYIYEPNDSMTWDKVKSDVTETVSRYVSNVQLTDIAFTQSEEEPNSIYVDMRYTVKKGNTEENNRLVVKI